MRYLKDPLVTFLIAGAGLFVVAGWLGANEKTWKAWIE